MSNNTETSVSYSVQNAGATTESWVPCRRWIEGADDSARFLPAEFDSFSEAEKFMTNQYTGGVDRYRIVMSTTVVVDTVVATIGRKLS